MKRVVLSLLIFASASVCGLLIGASLGAWIGSSYDDPRTNSEVGADRGLEIGACVGVGVAMLASAWMIRRSVSTGDL